MSGAGAPSSTGSISRIRKQQLADMVKALPRGKLASLEGYDYGIHFLAPERCVKALREFLAEQKR
jgi:hypothetical protein